jgi:hypothetical protein
VEPEEDDPNPSNNMVPQSRPEFRDFGESAQFFYEKFSASAPLRFERYLLSSGGREVEAAAKYRWNLELSEALMPCLHAAELALRNAIHQAMVKKYLPYAGTMFPDGKPADSEWWFDIEVRGVRILKQRDWEKVETAYSKIPQNAKPVTPRVVAELSFGFWVELLNSNYDESIVVPMLASTMRQVQKSNSANRTQGWLRERFGEIRDLRNRVTHHEPIYHRPELAFIWEMAWLLSSEITPWFTPVTKPACRFDKIRREGWFPHDAPIRNMIRTQLYEPFKKVMP